MHLGKGDKVLESIQSEMDRLGVKNAVLLSAIGSMRKLTFHVITETTDKSVDKFITIEDAIEVGAMQGLILDGEPHLHIICSDKDNNKYVGHLENGCEVQYLMELSFMEVKDLNLIRKKDEFDNAYIDEK
ncbi:MAG TPA: DNA-binding protein [Clostridiales bacterium]|jgi:predicted DNA-binding protein with PD1-like motif|nr:DNA-binding protein [Clostridiales bacterium]